MKKRVIALLLLSVFCLTLAGCSGKGFQALIGKGEAPASSTGTVSSAAATPVPTAKPIPRLRQKAVLSKRTSLLFPLPPLMSAACLLL